MNISIPISTRPPVDARRGGERLTCTYFNLKTATHCRHTEMARGDVCGYLGVGGMQHCTIALLSSIKARKENCFKQQYLNCNVYQDVSQKDGKKGDAYL